MHALRHLILGLFVAAGLFTTGCEDPVPTDYTEELVLEGFVIASEPITNIRIYRTLPITDTFKFANAMIRDAQVTLTADGTIIPMEYVADSLGGFYRASDTSLRAAPGVTYAIEVQARGRVLSASTKTPPLFNWTRPPKDTLQYPGKNNELVRFPELDIYWQTVPGITQYVIAVECLDTLEYGIYLNPQTPDTNRRLRDEDQFDDGTLVANERTRFGFVQQAWVPVVWSAFKWFGKHEIRIYAGDEAFTNWFRLVGFGRRSQYDYRLGNVNGGLGSWGSASVVRQASFLKKDVP